MSLGPRYLLDYFTGKKISVDIILVIVLYYVSI